MRDEPLDWAAFGLWLSMLLNRHGSDILRVKGLLRIAGREAPVVVQGVQHLIHRPVHLERWPDDLVGTRLVMIVRGLGPDLIRRSFDAFMRLAPPARPLEAARWGGDRDATSRGRGGPARADRPFRRPPAGRRAAARAAARGEGPGRRIRRLPRAGAHHLLPALADRGRGRARRLLRDARCRARRRRRCSTRRSKLGIGFYLGYAELDPRRTAASAASTPPILVDRARPRSSASTARCICPATPSRSRAGASSIWRSAISSRAISASRVWRALGGVVGMCICNDRRWPETYRVMGLQGVEMVMLGYNTPIDHTGHPGHRRLDRVPQPPVDAGRRLPERDLGRRHGQMRRRGGLEDDRPERDHRAVRARSSPGRRRWRTRSSPRAATSTWASDIARRSSTSPATASRRPIG